jgi:type IV secretory pathway component VirB8
MKKIIISMLAIILVITACKHSAEVSKKDPLESGRGFIESSLKGDYDEAQKYLLPDSVNLQYFEGLKDFNSKRSNDEKEGYKNANILIDSTQQLSDSVTIITYSNTYKNQPSKLKMVNEWLVDFKYTFNGNR